MRITLTADLRRIATFTTLETLENAGEPTLGEVHGDAFIYSANSPWSAFDEGGARKPATTIAMLHQAAHETVLARGIA